MSPFVILRDGSGPHEDNNFKIEFEHSRKIEISYIVHLVCVKYWLFGMVIDSCCSLILQLTLP